MFCPVCGAEYRDGFTWCSECQVSLVVERPASEEGEALIELRVVFKTGNPVLLSLAKSMLEEAGIEYVVAGEESQYLLGAGGSGIGFNPTTGPVRVQVRLQDADRAREVLENLEESASEGPADDHEDE